MMRTERAARRAGHAARPRARCAAGLRYVRSVPELWVPLVMMAIVGTLSYNFQMVFPLFVTRDLDGGDATFTLLFSVVSVGSLVGALLDRPAQRRSASAHVRLGSLGFGVAMAVMAVAPDRARWPSRSALLLGPAPASSFIDRVDRDRADPRRRPRCGAGCSRCRRWSSSAARPIGGPIVGWIAEQFGARYGMGVGAVAALAAGLWGLAAVRRGETVPVDAADLAVAEGDAEPMVA